MLAARYKFSPRTIDGIFNRSYRSKKSGYSVLVLPSEEVISKMAVVLKSSVAKTSIKRHSIKRSIYQKLEDWVKTGEVEQIQEKGSAFYLIVMVTNWELAEPQLRTHDWKETVEYLLEKKQK